MSQLSAVRPDPMTVLKVGQVAAWRSGMAHYRTGALKLCAELPAEAVRLALGLPASASVDGCRQALEDDPWADPTADGLRTSPQLQLLRPVGSFRGFGGLFLKPPKVAFVAGDWLVGDEENTWVMCADRFGATFHRVPPRPIPAGTSTSRFAVDPDGKVTRDGLATTIPVLAEPTSVASDGRALAVTTARSHAVYIVT